MRLCRVLLSIGVLLCSVAAFSQNASKVQVFGGYSLLHMGGGGITNSGLDLATGAPAGTFNLNSNFQGWTGEVQLNINDWVGVAADLSGNYGTRVKLSSASDAPNSPGGNSYTILFGPVVQQSTGKFRPFGHFLLGFNRDTSNINSLGDEIINGNVSAPIPNLTDSAFAMAFGGGVDWSAGKHLAVRLGQLDYLYTSHDYSAISNGLIPTGVFNSTTEYTHQNNLRYSAGLVFSFGGK
jgi:hypothetical protein